MASGFASATRSTTPTERVPMDRIWRVGALAIAAAIVANLVVWAIAQALFEISDDFMPLATPWPTIVVTVIYLALGVGVFALLNRFTQRPVTWFWRIAVAAALLSFLPLFGARGQDGASTAALWTLAVMHVVAFAIFVPLLTTRSRAG